MYTKELRELYEGCRSLRQFEQEPVSDEIMQSIMENVRIMSCAKNAQLLRYVVVRDPEICRQMFPMTVWATAVPKAIAWPREDEIPPTYVVVAKPKKAHAMIDVDMGIAANMICTTAWTHGIGSCILGALAFDKMKALLEIDEDYEVGIAIALGKPKHSSTIVDEPHEGSWSYYADEKRDFYVPKLPLSELVRWI